MACLNVNRKYVNKKKGKNPSRSNYKRGLKVGCINVRGLVSNVSKRVELNYWLEANEIDVVCIQEWFVPHGRQTMNELSYKNVNVNSIDLSRNDVNIGNNKNSNNNNNNDIDILTGGSGIHTDDECFDQFEDEKKYDQKYLAITLDMAAFPKYKKIEKNTKTIILYRTGLKIIEFDKLAQISNEGLDATWIGIETNRNLFIIGSIYHSPSYDSSYDELIYQMNHIDNATKKKHNHRSWLIGGDFNAKNKLWGSSITDRRGRQLSDWIVSNKLSYLNDGTNTYGTKKKGDVLDVTMVSQNDVNVVKKWYSN